VGAELIEWGGRTDIQTDGYKIPIGAFCDFPKASEKGFVQLSAVHKNCMAECA